ncbi:MAG: hypothetical protein NC131_12320 [Roseburia sp.]|nr:hypothetical protein [Roseburia sp.]
MEYKEMFALVKGMLLASIKGEPINVDGLNDLKLRLDIAIDNALVQGATINELEAMRNELLTIRKAVWYAN